MGVRATTPARKAVHLASEHLEIWVMPCAYLDGLAFGVTVERKRVQVMTMNWAGAFAAQEFSGGATSARQGPPAGCGVKRCGHRLSLVEKIASASAGMPDCLRAVNTFQPVVCRFFRELLVEPAHRVRAMLANVERELPRLDSLLSLEGSVTAGGARAADHDQARLDVVTVALADVMQRERCGHTAEDAFPPAQMELGEELWVPDPQRLGIPS